MRKWVCGIAVAGFAVLAAAAPVRAAPAMEPLDQTVCQLIEHAARANALPVGFITRIIWTESSFRAAAISPMGAEGIAQFMPGTAQERGLANPFDPEQAIPRAARLLADLRRQFGNLGAAAAAYNAGSARVESWLHGDAGLPVETRAYVRLVTLQSADEWRNAAGASTAPKAAAAKDGEGCLAVTAELRREGGAGIGEALAPLAPWGVQLAGNFSKARALAAFDRTRGRLAAVIGNAEPMIIGRILRSRGTRRFYQVRLPAPSRAAADALCYRIEAAGGVCIALRS